MNLIQTTTVELTDEEWAVINFAIDGMDAANRDEQFSNQDGVFGFFCKAFELALEQLFDEDKPKFMDSFSYLPMTKGEFETWAAEVIERKR